MKKITFVKLTAFLLLLSLTGSLSVLFAVSAEVSDELTPYESIARKIENREYDCYTDSENLYDPVFGTMTKDLKDYEENWYGSEETDNVLVDDNDIVHIIPREMFQVEGQYMYIGKTYGFFVNTAKDVFLEDPDLRYSVNNVDVLVFRIYEDNKTFLDGTKSTYQITVQNLFCRNYYYLTRPNASVDFTCRFSPDNIWTRSYINRSSALDLVVAGDFERTTSGNYFYYNSDDYVISDVVIGSSIRNEYLPNKKDANYDINADGGMFFTNAESGYFVVEDNPEFAEKRAELFGGLAADIANAVITAAFGPIGGVLGAAKEIYDKGAEIVGKVKEFIDYFNMPLYLEKTSGNISQGHISNPYAHEFNVSKESQIAGYGTLVKDLTCGLDEKGMTYRTGDYFATKFTVNDSGRTPARIENFISVCVQANEENVYARYRAVNGTAKSKTIVGSDRDNTVSTGETYGRLMPQGTRSFVLTPKLNEYYTIALDGPSAVSIVSIESADGETVLPEKIDGKDAYFLRKNSFYRINVANGELSSPHNLFDAEEFTLSVNRFVFDISAGGTTVFLPYGASAILRINTEQPYVYTVVSDCEAEWRILNSQLVAYSDVYGSGTEFTYPIYGNYFLATNNGLDKPFVFRSKHADEITLGTNRIDAETETKYFNFVPERLGQYSFTVSGEALVKLYGFDGSLYDCQYFSNSYSFTVTVEELKPYYLGAKMAAGSADTEIYLTVAYEPLKNEYFVANVSDKLEYTLRYVGPLDLKALGVKAYLNYGSEAAVSYFAGNCAEWDISLFPIYGNAPYTLTAAVSHGTDTVVRTAVQPYRTIADYSRWSDQEVTKVMLTASSLNASVYKSNIITPSNVKLVYILADSSRVVSDVMFSFQAEGVTVILNDVELSGLSEKAVLNFNKNGALLTYENCRIVGFSGLDGINGTSGGRGADGKSYGADNRKKAGEPGAAGFSGGGGTDGGRGGHSVSVQEGSFLEIIGVSGVLSLTGGNGGNGGNGGAGGLGGNGGKGGDGYWFDPSGNGGRGGDGGAGGRGGKGGNAGYAIQGNCSTEGQVTFTDGVSGNGGSGGNGNAGGRGGDSGYAFLQILGLAGAGGNGGHAGERGSMGQTVYSKNGKTYLLSAQFGSFGICGGGGTGGNSETQGAKGKEGHQNVYVYSDANVCGTSCYCGANISAAAHVRQSLGLNNLGHIFVCGGCKYALSTGHSGGPIVNKGNALGHLRRCSCNIEYREAHSWVFDPRNQLYTCSDCRYSSEFIPAEA